MKKTFMLVIVSFLLAGVVSAASLHGDFEGFPIVKVNSKGQELTVQNVPAVNLNGRTMVPIYMLRELGASVTWDQESQTADVSFSSTSTPHIEQQSSSNVIEVAENIMKIGGGGVTITKIAGSNTAITYFEPIQNIDEDWVYIYSILINLIKLDVEYVKVNYGSQYIDVKSSDLKDYVDGKLTDEQLMNRIDIGGTQNQNTAPIKIPNVQDVPELYSNDEETYLGKLTTNEFDIDSIFNEFGNYGSEFSNTSIWNELSKYGSEFSSESAFNDMATNPPAIVQDGEIIGYLTTNDSIEDAVSPTVLKSWLEDKGF